MKSEPPYAQIRTKKDRKFEPVQLVNQFILIIKILSNSPKGKNEIFREIQNYRKLQIPQLDRRPNVFSAIEYLAKGKIIELSKGKKLYKDNKNKYSPYELTEVGKELSNLITSIDSFVISYTDFKKQYKGNFSLFSSDIEDRKNKYILERIGWKKDEINKYVLHLNETAQIDQNIINVYIQSLLGRYISILLKYDITNFGKQVLGSIFLETLNKFIQSKNKSLKNLSIDDKILFFLHNICSDFYKFFIKNSPPNKSNRFIQKELDEILKSLFKILSPPTGYFKNPIIIGKDGSDNDSKEKYDYLFKLFG
jgi:hypothetical protein